MVGLGVGVGLSLSRAITHDHGGTLELRSATLNTCFQLLLIGARVAERGSQNFRIWRIMKLKEAEILIVEDEPMVREIFAVWLCHVKGPHSGSGLDGSTARRVY
jgi:hypothetical protein